MKWIIKLLGMLLLIYCLIALIWNSWTYWQLKHSTTPLTSNWYKYSKVQFYANDQIYNGLLKSIQINDYIWISAFNWPYQADFKLKDLPNLDIQFAEYLNRQHTKGEVFFDLINYNYINSINQRKENLVIQAAPNLQWYPLYNPNSLPNFYLMWIIHTPWLQNIINHSHLYTLQKFYNTAKLCANHQKIMVINHAGYAWIGSKNFNRFNWNNVDHMFEFRGDFAKAIYYGAAATIDYLNPAYGNILQPIMHSMNDVKANNIDFNHLPNIPLAKILRTAEIKPAILYFINNAKRIDAEINLFSDPDIIDALNRFLARGGQLRLILDPNLMMFGLHFPDMPNIIAITNINKKAELRIHKTIYQMHAKSALFVLNNNTNVFLSGSANWTESGLNRYAYNDMDFVVINDAKLNQAFLMQMEQDWHQATPRENVNIAHSNLKYLLTKLMLWTGFSVW